MNGGKVPRLPVCYDQPGAATRQGKKSSALPAAVSRRARCSSLEMLLLGAAVAVGAYGSGVIVARLVSGEIQRDRMCRIPWVG